MSSTPGFRRIGNGHYKPLSSPAINYQEMEIHKLTEEKKKLETVINLLCKQNSQIVEAHNRRNIFSMEETKELGRVERAVDRLQQGIERVQLIVKEMTSIREQSRSKLQEMMEQASQEWRDFCTEMNLEETEVEKVLEDIKERIIEKETEEIFIGINYTS